MSPNWIQNIYILKRDKIFNFKLVSGITSSFHGLVKIWMFMLFILILDKLYYIYGPLYYIIWIIILIFMSKALEFIEKFPVRVHLFKNFITKVKRAQNNKGWNNNAPLESKTLVSFCGSSVFQYFKKVTS